MNKWIAEFELEDGDTMPEHMDLKYEGAKIDFHCRPMWIPVSERLPGCGEEVLLSIGNGKYVKVGKLMEVSDDDGRYIWFYSGWYHSLSYVDAWMPLPEPYKGE